MGKTGGRLKTMLYGKTGDDLMRQTRRTVRMHPDRTVSEGSSEEENMTSAQQESITMMNIVLHIYYDLDGGNMRSALSRKRMTETDVYRTAEDSAVYEAMYFASIPNLYEASAFGGATTFEKLHVNTVYALFYKEDPIEPGMRGKGNTEDISNDQRRRSGTVRNGNTGRLFLCCV